MLQGRVIFARPDPGVKNVHFGFKERCQMRCVREGMLGTV
jgi:hypothetical protein